MLGIREEKKKKTQRANKRGTLLSMRWLMMVMMMTPLHLLALSLDSTLPASSERVVTFHINWPGREWKWQTK